MIARVLSSTSNKKEAEIENVLRGETILTSDDAKEWGLVQEIRKEFLEPGSVMVTLNLPAEIPPSRSPKYLTLPNIPIIPEWHGLGIAPASSAK